MVSRSQDFYIDLVAKHGEDSVIVTGTDGRVEWANGAFERLSGYTLHELIGRSPGEMLQGPDTAPETVSQIAEALRNRKPIVTELLNYSKTGQPYWIEISIKPIFDENGTHTHFLSVEHDITARRALEEQTRQALAAETARRNERKLISQTNEWIFAAKSQEDLVQFVAQCLQKLIPEASGQLYIYSTTRDILDLQIDWSRSGPPQHIEPDECWALRRGRAYSFGVHEIEFPCNHYHGSATPYFCIPLIAHGETLGLLHLDFDNWPRDELSETQIEQHLGSRWHAALAVSEQVSLAIANAKLRHELQEQSTRDPLTGLWNRRWFWETGRREITKASGRGTDLTIVSVDVDEFKGFNDRFGHDAGDAVLRRLAGLLEEMFEPPAASCRLGGDEFIVLCPGLAGSEAARIAEKLCAEASGSVLRVGDAALPPITVSAGIASFPADADDMRSLVKAADQALYAAKDGGRDQVASFSTLVPSMAVEAAE